MEISKKIFREYDIRGIYEKDIDREVAYLIGRAFATVLKNEIGKDRCVVGYDNRLSSKDLFDGLSNGIMDSGVDIINIGLVTTPMFYYACDFYQANCGMMITASHNPKEYNGFKFSYNSLHNAYGSDVAHLYDVIVKNEFTIGHGSIIFKDVKEDYINYLLRDINIIKKDLKVIYDCGNGTTSIVANDIFKRLGINTLGIYNDSDGNFPNHHPDPCEEVNLTDLKRIVLEENADLGVGFDGDGDRVGVVLENGKFIPVDLLMIIIWRDIYNKVDIKRGLFDVKCSKALEDEMIKLGIEPVVCRTGNSYTKAMMVSSKLPFGGELSGHVFFQDKFNGYDDGIYVALRLIEILSNTDKKVSQLLDGISKYYNTPEIKIPTPDDIKFDVVEEVKQYVDRANYKYLDIDGVKVLLDDGFALIRASNTGPNITLRFESKDEIKLEKMSKSFIDLINDIIKKKINN